jgi:hypothetical protein
LWGDGFGQLESNYAEWVTNSKHQSSLLQAMLARRINASGSSSWPTCRTNEGNGGDYQQQADGSTQPTLTVAATMWSTPHASDPQMDRRSDESVMRWANRAQAGCELSIQVRLWLTPSASEDAAGGPNGKMQKMLKQQAENWETFSRPVPATDAGPVSSPNTHTLRRRLNPAFACWLMGLPWWWTRAEPISFAAQETASWHSALRRRLRQFFEE